MNLKKIIIYQHKILFSILSEIKEKLNYDLIEADKDNFDQIVKTFKTDFLIISKKNKDNFKNQLILLVGKFSIHICLLWIIQYAQYHYENLLH